MGFSTSELVFARPGNLERYVPEEERKRRAARKNMPKPTKEQLADLRGAALAPHFDAPQMHRLLWGNTSAKNQTQNYPADAEQMPLGGVPCFVFGRSNTDNNAQLC